MLLAQAIRALGALPEALDQRLADLDDAQLHFKPDPDHFSVLENICHLRDIEVEGYAWRLELLLEEDDPVLPDLDGAALARERRYQTQAFAPALQAFLEARRRNLETLARLAPVDLERRGEFGEMGVIDLAQLLDMWVAHDREHLQELDQLLTAVRDPASKPAPSASLRQR
jgi:hypothetical protein